MNTFNLNLDLDKRGGVAQWVTLRQGDRRGTELRATIYDHGTQAGGGYTCRVSIRLPGAGDEYYRETATYTNGVAVVTVDEEYAAAIVGVTEGYFELLQGDAVIASTESFGVRILRSAQDGAVPGEKYDSAIEDALAELDEATGRISQMVVDATEEYLEAHPELTTTVEDNSLTDAKLIQHGGILDRVARLWHRLDNLLTTTPAESDSLTVTDAAKTPLAGLALYGRSTQDGTPTPSAPVPISSVTGNLYRETLHAVGDTWTSTVSVTKADYNRYIVNGTSSGTHWLWGGSGSSDDRLFVTLPAGTYTAVLGGADASKFSIATRGKINGSVTALSTSGNPNTFTIDSEIPVEVAIFTLANKTFTNSEVSIQLYEGSSAGGAFVPHGSVGLWAKRTSDATQQSVTPIDLQGHTLRSLPDGTRDEVTVDAYGHAVLVQRIERVVLDGSSDETWADKSTNTSGMLAHTVVASGIIDGSTLTSGNTVYDNLLCSSFPNGSDNGVNTGSYTCNTVVHIRRNSSQQVVFYKSGESLADFKTWLASNPVTLLYPLATPVTIDLGTIDPVALQGPDMTAQSVPTAPFQLTYERDLNVTLSRLEAFIADAATA